jgi:diamine N-acetyltransferase
VRGTFSTAQAWRPAVGAPLAQTLDSTKHSVAISPTSKPVAEVQLRDATPEDALCLSVLAMQVFLDTYATDGIRPEIAREVLASYSQNTFSKAIADSGSHITVAELNKNLIGFAQVTLSANQELAPSGKQAELLRLYVQEPFTAVKVGTQLLAQAERIAANSGATILWLTPWVYNFRAIAFYAKRGYTDYGLTYFTFEGESHENRVLAKSVARTCAV